MDKVDILNKPDDLVQLWNYYPNFFPSSWYQPLYDELKDKVTGYMSSYNGKLYPSKRISCFFVDTSGFASRSDLRSVDIVDSRDFPEEISKEEDPEEGPITREVNKIFEEQVKKVDARSQYFSYSRLPAFDWKDSTMISKIRFNVQHKLKTSYDYCLCHIYRDGKDDIGWHADRESLDLDIASVSFGATRKFRLRRKDNTKGWDFEYQLNSGDLFHMLPGCQKKYKHCVPKETKVKESRINITFRKFDSIDSV